MTGTKMKRNLQVDTLRGIACILLVLFHVVGDTPDSGLRIPEGDWMRDANQAMAYLRMPLFSFISGYVYGFRPYQGDPLEFVKGKARRLLLPLISTGTIFALMQAMTPDANSAVDRWWLLHIEPVGHFWFLEALFIIFLLVLLLERLKAISTASGFAAFFGLSVVMFVHFDPPNYFAARGAVYLLPFFLSGLACKRFEIVKPSARLLAAAVFILAVVAALRFPQFSNPQASLVALALGISSAFLLLRSGLSVKNLAYIGSFSFAIYLLHVFFTAGSRIFFRKIGVTDTYALVLLGVGFGVAGPIAAALIIGRYKTLNLWLLGSTSKAVAARPASTAASSSSSSAE